MKQGTASYTCTTSAATNEGRAVVYHITFMELCNTCTAFQSSSHIFLSKVAWRSGKLTRSPYNSNENAGQWTLVEEGRLRRWRFNQWSWRVCEAPHLVSDFDNLSAIRDNHALSALNDKLVWEYGNKITENETCLPAAAGKGSGRQAEAVYPCSGILCHCSDIFISRYR